MTVAEEASRRGALPADQADRAGAELSATRRIDKVALYVRFSCHVAVWVCVLVPGVLVLARGWTPLGDYATIELRAYRTFSHPSLVGMFSTVGWGVGHRVFDPGPLSFWMLAAPVRIDPSHGLIWGSVLLWGLLLSLAIEAMWSSGYWVGCALIALAVIDLLWLAPSVLENMAWNAYLPLPFLIAALATAFLVAKGSFGWWPILVFAASVAAQTHLLYLLPSVGLMLIALVLGFQAAGKPKRFRWLATGLGVAVLCWFAPVIQGLGANSNLAALARGTGGVPTMGLGFGFRLLGDGAGAVPIWLVHAPTRFYPEMAFAFSHPPAYGMVALTAIIFVTAFAALTRRRGLFAAGALTLVTTSAFLVSFAMIPTANLIVVGYLLGAVWVEGFLIWIVVTWCLLSICRSLAAAVTQRRNSNLRGSSLPGKVSPDRATTPAVAACGFAAIAFLAGGSSVAIATTIPANPNFGTNWSRQEADEVASIVSVVEHNTARGDVNVTLDDASTDRLRSTAIGEGVGLQLLLDGWHPGLRGIDPAQTSLPPIAHSVDISVEIDGNTIGVSETRS